MQKKKSIFKNQLFTSGVTFGHSYFSLLGILGNLASSFREEGVKDYRNFKKKAIP